MAEDFDYKAALLAEIGELGPDGWRYADTGDPLWTRWLGPPDDNGERTFPLLHVRQLHVGHWDWLVIGPKYKTISSGLCSTALQAMQAAEAAAKEKT